MEGERSGGWEGEREVERERVVGKEMRRNIIKLYAMQYNARCSFMIAYPVIAKGQRRMEIRKYIEIIAIHTWKWQQYYIHKRKGKEINLILSPILLLIYYTVLFHDILHYCSSYVPVAAGLGSRPCLPVIGTRWCPRRTSQERRGWWFPPEWTAGREENKKGREK